MPTHLLMLLAMAKVLSNLFSSSPSPFMTFPDMELNKSNSFH